MSNYKILKNLLASSNHCFYCKTSVIKNRKGSKICRSNSATVDHIYSKTDIRRFIVQEENNVVLACYSCNQKKGVIENTEYVRYNIIAKNANVSIIGALVHRDIGQTY